MPIPEKVPHLIDVVFSDCLDGKDLEQMHQAKSVGSLPDSVRQVVMDAGARDITCVYEMTANEVADDKFGLAREFKIYLRPEVDADAATKILKRSGLVDEAAVVLLHRAS